MNAYFITIMLILPAQPGVQPVILELQREHISASSDLACQRYADKLADDQARRQAENVKRLKAKVTGSCTLLGQLS